MKKKSKKKFVRLLFFGIVYRVRTINPDRFDRPTGRKCEKKIQEFFFLIIKQLSDRKKKNFLNFFFWIFYFYFWMWMFKTFWHCAGIGDHRRPLKAVLGNTKKRSLQNQFLASWFNNLQLMCLKISANLAHSLR